ncbi:MAG: aminoglycoside phosphotransferase family protein [Patescibacteria group bacterium]|nr:aminoglycoside phosphotransferase family protein [Patescibacteria group bacterium]
MDELPTRFSDVASFTKIANLVRSGKEKSVTPNPQLISKISPILTPTEYLHATQFEQPETIDPKKYPDFDSLMKERERIRNLQLVPVKRSEDWKGYNRERRGKRLDTIAGYLKDADFAYELNLYPYDLPPDTDQYILWLKDKNASPETVAQYAAQVVQALSIDPDEMIVFERSMEANSRFVRGSVPEFRHLHVWVRKRNSTTAKLMGTVKPNTDNRSGDMLPVAGDIDGKTRPDVAELRRNSPDYFASLVEPLHEAGVFQDIEGIDDITDTNVRALGGGESSACYWVEDRENVVVKFRRKDIEAEAQWLKAAREKGVDVPEVKAYGVVPSEIGKTKPVKYIALEGVTDETGQRARTFWQRRVEPGGLAKIAGEMGRELAKIHTVEIDKPYGASVYNWEDSRPVRTWNEWLNNTLGGTSFEKMGFTREERERLARAIVGLDIPDKRVLIHGDFGLHNALIISTDPPRVKIFDPNPMVADPYYDLAYQYNRMEIKREKLKSEPENEIYRNRWRGEQEYFNNMIDAYSKATDSSLPKTADEITDPRLIANQILRYFESLRYDSTAPLSNMPPADRREKELETEVKRKLLREKIDLLIK